MDEERQRPPQAEIEMAPAIGATDRSEPPPWLWPFVQKVSTRAVWVLILAAIGTLAIVGVGKHLLGVVSILFTSLFLSFAIEPAVNWLHSHGWRRGAATGVIFLLVLAAFILLFVLIVPAVISGFKQLAASAPSLLAKIQRFAARFGVDFSTTKLQADIKANANKIVSTAFNLLGGVLGIGASVLGKIFRWATIALFTFYAVAEGPQLRHAICSRVPKERQEKVLFVWNLAIKQTGAYFYSRLLLATINGTGMYILLRVLGVPFAAPLALFEGIIAEFIPVVGTYIAGVAPVLIALLESVGDGIGVLAYILVYQQVENYILSPRLTAKTMSLHPAVTFAAALIGGSLGGVLMAFLALPAAGVIQAAFSEYGKHYDVVDSRLTEDQPERPVKDKTTLRERFRRKEDAQSPDDDPPGAEGSSTR